jgi:cyclase
MLKKRLIFTLLYKDGDFCLSRNFRLQRVGNISWLLDSYNFKSLAGVIDELVILDLSDIDNEKSKFFLDISRVIEEFFIPVSIGGNIHNLEDAKLMFSNGADKIVLNTLFHTNQRACVAIAEKYGSQAVVGSVDFAKVYNSETSGSSYQTYFAKKREPGLGLKEHLERIQRFGCGEILLRSIDRDGTSNGLDIGSLQQVPDSISIPLILSGGIGKPIHMLEGLKENSVDAIATANLLNFVGDGFHNAKKFLIEEQANVTLSLN